MDSAGAIADPVRREILQLLRLAPMTAGEVAGRFSISRPAISRHLRVLRESGLVRVDLTGRERHYTLDTAPLADLRDWLDRFLSPPELGQPQLEHRLDALETEVQRTRRERRQRWPSQPNQKPNADRSA